MKKTTFFALILIFIFSCSKKEKKVVKTINIPNKKEQPYLQLVKNSGITFSNKVIESSKENSFNYEFIYNGSGVAIGDINNDGLPDIYFAGNQANDKLYLNKGGLKFEDISKKSGILKENGWSTGVNMVDINSDGLLDIYVCRSGPTQDPSKMKNQLFINNGDLTFTESASKYGIDNSSFSIQATFFDYDLDGDLDMYLLNHPDPKFKATKFKEHINKILKGKLKSDVFYENINGKYYEKSREANLTNFGYRHGIAIADINNDNYPDIYISSDFDEPDLLLINTGKKSYKNVINNALRHISYNSMGNEIVDINNDGLEDVFVVDMAPKDHVKSKEYMKSMNPKKFYTFKNYGFHKQYMQNTMHLNNGNNSFSEIAQIAGISKTDWSWAPLFFDINLDGKKDLFISNGIKYNTLYRDLNKNIQKKMKEVKRRLYIEEILKLTPSNITPNVVFKNTDGINFKDVSKKWIDFTNVNSNGIAYGDLDNDGDLDLVTNNMEHVASVFENKASNIGRNFIKIKLIGDRKNTYAIGSKIKIITENSIQLQELNNAKGYLSSVDYSLIFGLGDLEIIPKIEIIWPNGKVSVLKNQKANNTLTIDYKTATFIDKIDKSEEKTFLTKINPHQLKINYKHKENKFNDFKKQILLPHSQSHNGPYIEKGDVNNDGLEDFFIGGAIGQGGSLFIQSKNGTFKKVTKPFELDKNYEDLGIVFIDYDNDKDLDLYIVSGGSEYPQNSDMFQDRLYKNDGKGNFTKTKNVLPKITTSGQVVKPQDIDNDGDIDLFIGGRIIPDKYPYPPNSYFLINNNGTFSLSKTKLDNLGMVTDAVFSDYDNDGDNDLIVVGEWSKINILNNNNGSFSLVELPSLKNTRGLWFSIEATDIDNDGDDDYFVGNLGLNAKFSTKKGKEFHIFCDDFDKNGTYDIVLSNKYKGRLVPVRGRECSSQQIPSMKSRFPTYNYFANASLTDMFGDERLKHALHYQANTLSSVFLENTGNGTFKIKELPSKAQFSPIMDFKFIDINNDNVKEIIAVGNIFNSEVETVSYDASIGTILSYKNNHFNILDSKKTGFKTSGDSKNLMILNNNYIIVTNNDGNLDVFKIK